MLRYRRIALTVKPHLTQKEEIVRHLVSSIRSVGAEVLVDRSTLGDIDWLRTFESYSFGDDVDALLVVGGDGTILRAVRELPNLSVPILSVNRGVVGFLTEIAMDETVTLLPQLLRGEGIVEERHLLHIHVERAHRCVFEGLALNEAAITQGAIARLLDVRTQVDGEALAFFHADGLIIATPTGSTAYSLAAGGPVVHPSLFAIILTPINPHNLAQKPIVISGSGVVRSEILTATAPPVPPHISLTIDGQTFVELRDGDCVTVRMHDAPVRLIRRNEETFYKTLRTKLRWA